MLYSDGELVDYIREENFRISHLITAEEKIILQKLIAEMSVEFDIATVLSDPDGTPVFPYFNFSELCQEHIRGCEEGLKRCKAQANRQGSLSEKLGEPLVYECHAGIMDFTVPIMLLNRRIGNISGGGRVRTKILDEETCEKFARYFDEIGVANKEKALASLCSQKLIDPTRIVSLASIYHNIGKLLSNYFHFQAEYGYWKKSLLALNVELEQRIQQRTKMLEETISDLNTAQTLRQSQNAELQRNAEIQSVLREIAEAAVLASSVNELYATVHRLVERVLPAKKFYIALLDEAAGQIVRPYCVDERSETLRQRPVRKGLTEYVMRQGRAMHLNRSELIRLREIGEVGPFNAPGHEYLGAPLKDSTGKIFGVIALNAGENDYTFQEEDIKILSIIASQVSMAIERKRSEEELRENGIFLKSLLNAIPVPVFYKDTEGRFIGFNKAFENLIGRTHQEIVGKSVFDIAPTKLANTYHAKDLELLNQQCTQEYETQVKDAQGVVHDVVFHKATFTGSDGNLRGLIGAILEITERKRAEKAIHSSEVRYHALMEQSAEGLAVIDIQTQEVAEVNRRFTEMLGYSLPEDAPLYVNKFAIDSKANLDKYYNETLRQQAFLPPEAREYRHKNGIKVHAERAATVISIDGKDYLLASLRDMTEERRRQTQLKRDMDLAQRVQQGLLPEVSDSSFVNIRTLYYPLNFISGDSYHLQWLNEEKLLRGFLIDVSGHGLATAIQTSAVNMLLREAVMSPRSQIELMKWINTRLLTYFADGAFAAMLGFELDLSLRELRYVGAGITQFYVNGRKRETPGMLVGLWKDAEFTAGKITVSEADTFHFLTDGLTDALAQPENADFWSLEGKNFDADVAALERLAGSCKLRDDATGICLKVRKLYIRVTDSIKTEISR